MKNKYLFYFLILTNIACLGYPAEDISGKGGCSLRRARTIELDFEHIVGQLLDYLLYGGKESPGVGGAHGLGILRNFVLDIPTFHNYHYLKGVKGEIREDALARALTLLIKEAFGCKDSMPRVLHNLTYTLRSLYLESSTQPSLMRIFNRSKEISLKEGISPGIVPSYIDRDIIGASQSVSLLDMEQGKALTLGNIRMNPEGTYVGLLDVDSLSLLNRAFGKSTLDYVLDDISRTVAVTLSQFDGSFAYTNSGRDEIYITLCGIKDKAEVEKILNIINQRVRERRYFVIKLNEETNTAFSALPRSEFEKLKQILTERGVGISNGEYVQGEYLLLVPLSPWEEHVSDEVVGNFLQNLLTDLNRHLENSASTVRIGGDMFYLDRIPFNRGFLSLVTVSLGAAAVSFGDPEGAYQLALGQANISLRTVKEAGKNDVRIYEPSMEKRKFDAVPLSEELLDAIATSRSKTILSPEQSDPLYPAVYKSSHFRDMIQGLIRQGKHGFLIWIEPGYYSGLDSRPLQFKEINAQYGLTGGDCIIQSLFYLLEKNILPALRDSLIIGRNPPDGLLIYLPEANATLSPEQIGMISELLDSLKKEFEQYAGNLRIYFDAAIKGTHDISQVGRLFALADYTRYSTEAVTVFPSEAGNTIKLYTPAVQDEIRKIQQVMQEEALREMSQSP